MSKSTIFNALPNGGKWTTYKSLKFYVMPNGDTFRKYRQTNNFYAVKWHLYDTCGHVSTRYLVDGKFVVVTRHRLVATTFISNPNNYPCVLHKDEKVDANGELIDSVNNLFWGTQMDNISDKVSKRRHPHGSSCSYAKLNEKTVDTIRFIYSLGTSKNSLAGLFNVSEGCIQAIVERRTWKHI